VFAFGFGIVLYFAAEREPTLWAACALAVAAIIAAVLVRQRPIGFPVAIAVAAVAAGFATATLKRAIIAHPVLQAVAWNVQVAGFVEVREERERSDRIVVRVHSIDGPRLPEKPERVRVSVRKGTAPAVGAFVTFKVRLTPPLEPLLPGDYDFGRDMYFGGIGGCLLLHYLKYAGILVAFLIQRPVRPFKRVVKQCRFISHVNVCRIKHLMLIVTFQHVTICGQAFIE